jgi:hypothetical protein
MPGVEKALDFETIKHHVRNFAIRKYSRITNNETIDRLFENDFTAFLPLKIRFLYFSNSHIQYYYVINITRDFQHQPTGHVNFSISISRHIYSAQK